MIRNTDIEIMAPAGSRESLMAAIGAGADSVYFGVGSLNMRARSSSNFTLEDLAEIVSVCRNHGVKTYLTVNTVIYDEEMEEVKRIVDRARTEGMDAVIASDQAVILYAREQGVEVHISTQLNVSNFETLKFYSRWADVVVLARELSLPQIKKIHDEIIRQEVRGPGGELVKIEMFAHGALCMAVSGKCYLSLHDSGCSANRGSCRQLCRRSYMVTDMDTGEQMTTEGNYIFSPKDLCTIEFLDSFAEAGVRVLKIEGRARSGEYVKRVVECYREAVDALAVGNYTPELTGSLKEKLSEVFNRGFWGGYYLGSPVAEISGVYGSAATKRKVYVGKVTNYFKNIGVAEIFVEASPLENGSQIIFSGETTGIVEQHAEIYVGEKPAQTAPQGCYCSVKTGTLVRRGDKVYKMVDADQVPGQG